MIGNKYLLSLFKYPDEDTGINQLLDYLKMKNKDFMQSLYEPVNLDNCSAKELDYLTKISALIDYHLQLIEMEVPDWLRDDRLSFDKPYYLSKNLSDFDKVKLQYTCPAPFRARNVYFDLEGIKRV